MCSGVASLTGEMAAQVLLKMLMGQQTVTLEDIGVGTRRLFHCPLATFKHLRTDAQLNYKHSNGDKQIYCCKGSAMY